MAQFYFQKAGKREDFHNMLKTIVETDLNKYPEIMADNFFYQKKPKLFWKMSLFSLNELKEEHYEKNIYFSIYFFFV